MIKRHALGDPLIDEIVNGCDHPIRKDFKTEKGRQSHKITINLAGRRRIALYYFDEGESISDISQKMRLSHDAVAFLIDCAGKPRDNQADRIRFLLKAGEPKYAIRLSLSTTNKEIRQAETL